MTSRALMFVALAFLYSAISASASLTPFNSWRALIVYTNSIYWHYGGTIANLYKDYFASMADGMNQAYEDSDVGARVQIAGVIWDKTYAEMHPSHYTGYPGCGNLDDLTNPSNGMERYVALMNKYSADVIILVHTNTPGGCATFRAGAEIRGYGAFWVRDPLDVELWSHEAGHIHDAEHQHGHRITLNAAGKTMGGPVPDTMSFVVRGDAPGMVDHIVETEVGAADRGFHTTMTYADGGGCKTLPFSHTYGGVYRTFAFNCHGLWGPYYGWTTQWAGVYSNPDQNWHDVPTSTYYRMGGDDTSSLGKIGYIRRLKYLGGPEVLRDTAWFDRNVSAKVRSSEETFRNFKGVPSHVAISSNMSVGQNSADSQWVYAHIAATNSVAIEPGFSVTGGILCEYQWVPLGVCWLRKGGHATCSLRNNPRNL